MTTRRKFLKSVSGVVMPATAAITTPDKPFRNIRRVVIAAPPVQSKELDRLLARRRKLASFHGMRSRLERKRSEEPCAHCDRYGAFASPCARVAGEAETEQGCYLGVQTIYYPGFTIGGMFGEAGAMLAMLMLMFVTPFASTSFWLTLVAFLCLLTAHGVFWIAIQPLNKVWLKGQRLQGAGAALFGSTDARQTSIDCDWTTLRD
ncbi:hypothetical protein [Cupriavidus sp. D39]|uniref:hypothetical protein n=1 Tax=Cupriavidus sp. D39 TaxID=2997877 RepID=UPI00226F26A5|nr:hypothetical protein [Cupriavidus sp. D39]MCY0853326.1 hypothetical protein [Cupriavidus sp. D39]